MYQSIISGIKPKMQLVIDKMLGEFKNLRIGKANSSLVDDIKVEYYGTLTPIRQMATISIPDAKTISIQPWDRNNLGDIELAVRNAGLGLNPVNNGSSVVINLPPLTEERRQELVKHIKVVAEEARVMLRNVRQDSWNQIKALEKDSKLTEDDRYRAEEELNKIIDDFNRKIEEETDKKSAELMKV
ncbi:MAG: hypothetical protein ACD_58C00120G0014 [uncultured bacterium]|nr:MAG: hypothetical protein ACD_58C00120G0014 [uncultured bacterium]